MVVVVNAPLLRVGVVEVWQGDVLCSFLTEMTDWIGSFEQAGNFGRIEGELELVEVETEQAGVSTRLGGLRVLNKLGRRRINHSGFPSPSIRILRLISCPTTHQKNKKSSTCKSFITRLT